MAFSETLTLEIRRRAHFRCCLCHELGVEIHHIIPQSEGGADAAENAAPLCPSCHETYGANPTKRKFIREAKAFWFDICDKRYASDSSLLHEVHAVITNTASKKDVSLLRSEIAQVLKAFKPNRQARTLSIPLKQISDGRTRELSVRDLLVLVVGTSIDRPDSQVELLCVKELWPIKHGYRTVYNEFRQRFGDRTLRYLASQALDDRRIETRGGLTEEQIEQSLKLMAIEAICMTALDKGDLRAALNESNQVVWSVRDSAS